ncbi:GIY-YIG nuclease family protein [Mechercharimyces sp. CAU 1602]|uniref:GIY-YIG nuclease family protein n=1 Tax=Mechercharimyces sp. CAU 1602 TaxID=2973933 RepID=UPI0021617710|nr:GIY-YIG nuclease family protein [Mechercharimyces sp. CAU 1602]MCS1352360.1 GIY-YIG nuclease family protein [Mechercharimyces sp. CAU 1602]
MSDHEDYVVYMVQCGDGSLYTGITKQLEKRLAEHRAGKGAKYTRGRNPLTVRYVEMGLTHSKALRREQVIKRLRRTEKLKLIAAYEGTVLGE